MALLIARENRRRLGRFHPRLLKRLFLWVRFMKLKPSYATEAHVNSDGYYIIEQNQPGEEDGGIVWLSRDQAARIAADIIENLKNPSWGLDEAE